MDANVNIYVRNMCTNKMKKKVKNWIYTAREIKKFPLFFYQTSYIKNNYNCGKFLSNCCRNCNNKSGIHFHKVWEILNFNFRKRLYKPVLAISLCNEFLRDNYLLLEIRVRDTSLCRLRWLAKRKRFDEYIWLFYYYLVVIYFFNIRKWLNVKKVK